MNTICKQSLKPLESGHGENKQLILQYIILEIERGTGKMLVELKKQYSEDKLFYIGLKHVTTTKKAYCEALQIPIEAGCRYKRALEKNSLLVQSIDEVLCPYTKHLAHQISTNSKEFERLLKSSVNQLKLF